MMDRRAFLRSIAGAAVAAPAVAHEAQQIWGMRDLLATEAAAAVTRRYAHVTYSMGFTMDRELTDVEEWRIEETARVLGERLRVELDRHIAHVIYGVRPALKPPEGV